MISIDFWNVFYVHDSTADNFTAQLFRLIAKSDRTNQLRLSLGYPIEVALYQWWISQPLVTDLKEARKLINEKVAELENQVANPK